MNPDKPTRGAGMNYAVQASALTETIYVGHLNSKGDAFLGKRDRTDMVLAAVAEYVKRNFDGGMTATFPRLDGGLRLEVKVSKL